MESFHKPRPSQDLVLMWLELNIAHSTSARYASTQFCLTFIIWNRWNITPLPKNVLTEQPSGFLKFT